MKKAKIRTHLINPIIKQEMLIEKVLRKVEYIAIKCHNKPDVNDSRLTYMAVGSAKYGQS